ncbi:MAG: type I glutamate--ammonia ligase [Candidatus Electryonea clarkiae]|nr:type I glutamate--ammonia ligase [Candidatus Electryonea clarkiae]MDP8286536.1 type I glutamate--ammonia ligase [Candidatus Electryonea clarkiae]
MDMIHDLFELTKSKEVKMIDLRFMDFPGLWQHFSVPVSRLNPEAFEKGYGFDGSSIRGWRQINESDMLVRPDASTAVIDPFAKHTTLILFCDIIEPTTMMPYSKCPRTLARKAEDYLKSLGFADTAYFGAEAEFYIFDDIRYSQNEHEGYFHIDSKEGHWNSGREENPNLGYKPRYKEGYFPVPPQDSQQDIRSEMSVILESMGITIEAHHHEVGTGGQGEIDMRFNSMLKIADQLQLFKYVVKNVSFQHNKTATFMPKPIFMDNGSGMHTHMSLWKAGVPLFAGDRYAGLSEMALYFAGGILKHAPALCAFANPTTNSYKRLIPGYEAPTRLAYSQRNRSAAIRIPMYDPNPKAKRIEFRVPDSSCNPYIAFSALLMAGLDGIQNKIHPGDPLDKNMYDLEPEELAEVPETPPTLANSLDALEADQDFLYKGNVFTEDVVDTWIWYKREKEVNALRQRPHPWEFELYYDI